MAIVKMVAIRQAGSVAQIRLRSPVSLEPPQCHLDRGVAEEMLGWSGGRGRREGMPWEVQGRR